VANIALFIIYNIIKSNQNTQILQLLSTRAAITVTTAITATTLIHIMSFKIEYIPTVENKGGDQMPLTLVSVVGCDDDKSEKYEDYWMYFYEYFWIRKLPTSIFICLQYEGKRIEFIKEGEHLQLYFHNTIITEIEFRRVGQGYLHRVGQSIPKKRRFTNDSRLYLGYKIINKLREEWRKEEKTVYSALLTKRRQEDEKQINLNLDLNLSSQDCEEYNKIIEDLNKEEDKENEMTLYENPFICCNGPSYMKKRKSIDFLQRDMWGGFEQLQKETIKLN